MSMEAYFPCVGSLHWLSSETTFRVRFQRFNATKKSGVRTVCIVDLPSRFFGVPLRAYATARCHKQDVFDRYKGKTLSLKRATEALDNLGWFVQEETTPAEAVCNPRLLSTAREAIWAEFARMHQMPTRSTCSVSTISYNECVGL